MPKSHQMSGLVNVSVYAHHLSKHQKSDPKYHQKSDQQMSNQQKSDNRVRKLPKNAPENNFITFAGTILDVSQNLGLMILKQPAILFFFRNEGRKKGQIGLFQGCCY